MGSVRFGVLGPLVATGPAGPVALPGPRHRAVLARLLVARGRVVPVERLVDDLWEVPPDGAVGAVQTFVSALRRALEPDRPPRAPATVLVTSPPGYALRAEDVDAWRFEDLVGSAGTSAELGEALALWRGPAYAEFAEHGWARAEAGRLEELRLLAVERRAAALVAEGRAAEAVPDLEVLVEGHPWREESWRLLALAQYHAGRQGDALRVLRRARELLAAELGVDPGPALRALESDILQHNVPAAGPARVGPSRAAGRAVVPSRAADVGRVAGRVVVPAGGGVSAGQGVELVGREAEVAVLEAAAGAVVDRPRLVLVSGEAGIGKTALVEAFAARLARSGWTTAQAANPDTLDTPAAWPWTRLLDALGGPGPSGFADRFHWHQAVLEHLAGITPLLLVLDDLHWADPETLDLLTAVLDHPMPVLVVATYRDTDPGPALTAFLGRAARREPARLHLRGLSPDAVADLVRRTTGRADEADTVHRRSGGNPFFVRELARLLATDPAPDTVPAGVRDVVRHRLAQVPDPVGAVLRHAAVIGTEVDLDVLDALLGDVLDAVDTAAERGFLVEHAPGRYRFAHVLVRDTLYQDLSATRRSRLHAQVADAIEALRPDDAPTLAHHLLAAGDTTARAGRAARAAAAAAEARFAPHEAARLYRAALDRGPESRLDVLMGLVRTLAVTGDLPGSRAYRAAALDLAAPQATARVITAADTPTIWTTPDDPDLARRVADAAEHALAGAADDAERSRLLATIALELRNTGGARAREAACEAERLARRTGDPAVLAFALNARFIQCFERAGLAPQRAAIGSELVALAAEHGLVPFEVLGHLILVQAHSALADFTTADDHAARADRLAQDHRLPLVGVFTDGYRALRATVAGEPDPYPALAARLSGTGMTGVDVLPLAGLCFAVQSGRPVAIDVPDDPPRDLLYEARACLRAVRAIQDGDRPTMSRLYTDLLPAEHELAGAGSGILTLRPVAHYLGDLATTLFPNRAAQHYRHALDLARKAGAPHWIAAAEAALR
ncbi:MULTISPECIES: BTAD domain-containing putative transcriptional regulator [unclassified Saccharothrix]|uniref:BTAD domain-containing putative transcriptional regulator n=1 Tax=unclassified Saccharothrix TaxID=2593673 RepID=UPI00307D61B0